MVSEFVQVVTVSITVKIYSVRLSGEAMGFGILGSLSPLTGDQLYEDVTLVVVGPIIKLSPLQIMVSLPTSALGSYITIINTVS